MPDPPFILVVDLPGWRPNNTFVNSLPYNNKEDWPDMPKFFALLEKWLDFQREKPTAVVFGSTQQIAFLEEAFAESATWKMHSYIWVKTHRGSQKSTRGPGSVLKNWEMFAIIRQNVTGWENGIFTQKALKEVGAEYVFFLYFLTKI